MTANRLTLKREKRAFPMKRLLMPATALTTLKKVAFTLLCCTVLMVFAAPTAQAQDACSAPTIGPGTGHVGNAAGAATCGVIITILPNGQTPTVVGTGLPAYDNSEDTLVGIINNSGAPLSSITLSAASDIFGFDNDGPCDIAYHSPVYSWCLNAGFTGYEGPDNTFINYGSLMSGTVVFTTPIPNLGSTWFALEGPPSSLTGVTLAPILTVTELGTGTGTVTDNQTPQVINCGEANGYPNGTCTGTYSSSVESVILTATPNTTPSSTNPNGSAFLQWGGACASSGTANTCTVPVTMTQGVTADFIPIPTPIPFTLSGTNATAHAVYACPSDTSPCVDPNAYAMSVQFPAVTSAFGGNFLYILATEVYATGICPVGQVPFYGEGFPSGTTPPDSTTDFDCRLEKFFNYGTDMAGDVIVPLCDAYANGNCVHYLVYYGTPGTPPPTSLYTGPVFETITYNNPFTPAAGSFWNGSIQRTIVDPDADEATPSVPWGTNCSSITPMLVEATSITGSPDPNSQTGYSTATSPAIYCQFDEDATTFFNTSAPVDGGSGSKTQQPNDFVVAFQPTTSTGLNTINSLPIPTPVAPTLAGMCVNGCTPLGPVSSGGSITFTEGAGGTFDVSITAGYPAPNLTESGATLPSGLTFNPATGIISGTPADGTAGNYSISFSASNGVGSPAMLNYMLTVSAAPLTITASSAIVPYGTGIPMITPTIVALVNGDMASVLGTINCSAAVPAGNPVGTYATNCSGAMDSTYTFSYVPGTLQITKVPLTITASSATIIYGAAVPPITPTFTLNGLVNGDTPMTLGVTCSTTATNTSMPGSYPSSCTASNGGNYTITNVNGTVTVVGLDVSPLTVNFGNLYLWQIGVQGITLTNKGTSPITISSITIGGGSAPGDYYEASLCPPMILRLPATLPAGKSCAIGVGILATAKVFSPNPSTTYLTITDSAATQTVLLTALVTDPVVSLSKTSLSFGNEKTGTTSVAQQVTLTNSGLTPLTLTGLTISANFAFAPGTTCTALPLLSPGGTCLIYVNFTPTSKGTKYSGSVTITDQTLFGKQTISLSGTGN
jgi:hypothetical protein